MDYNITPKKVYNLISSNEEILKIYKQIENNETNNGGMAFHNIEHVKNVMAIAEKILQDLNFDEDTIYKCKIACLLHDVGALQGKEEHAKRSYEYAQQLFKDKNWIFKDSESVLDAIRNHSDGFETNNIITLAIILADKLDVKKTRITELGKQIEGNRQYGHMDDIIINIQDNVFSINFITDGNMIMEEVNNYYFTKKVFKAIEAFSKKLNLEYSILMDGEAWNIEKRMNKEELIQLIETLKIDKNEFWLLSSSALVMRGIYPDAGDLDIAVTEKGFQQLKDNYNLQKKDNNFYIVNDKVECVIDTKEDWKIEKCGEYNLQSIEMYYEYLKGSNREKDKARIGLVEEYMNRRK